MHTHPQLVFKLPHLKKFLLALWEFMGTVPIYYAAQYPQFSTGRVSLGLAAIPPIAEASMFGQSKPPNRNKQFLWQSYLPRINTFLNITLHHTDLDQALWGTRKEFRELL